MGVGYFPLQRPTSYTATGHGKETPYAAGAIANAALLDKYGNPAEKTGLQNLNQMLLSNGRVDPRLLASLQAQNARSTQQQQDAARAGAARNGLGGGRLNQALQAAIGAAGSNRSSNLAYQDISDSYKRNQENLGLLNQLVTQPQLGYASLSADLYKTKSEADTQTKAARLGVIGSVFQGIGGMFGGCWVAEAIFGKDAIETMLARVYVNVLAPQDLRDAYMEHGQELAEIVGNDEEMKAALRPTFLAFGDAAFAVLGG